MLQQEPTWKKFVLFLKKVLHYSMMTAALYCFDDSSIMGKVYVASVDSRRARIGYNITDNNVLI